MENNIIEYDQLFIVIEGTKFVIYERANNEIIPESKIILDNFLKALNKKGYSYFLRYGWLSILFLFIGVALMIILPIFKKYKFMISLVMFLIGFFFIVLYKHLRKKFAKKIKDTYFYHERKIERYYSIYYAGEFSKSHFSLNPKIRRGLSLDSSNNNNIQIINQGNNFTNPNIDRNLTNRNNINRNQIIENNRNNYPDINSNSNSGGNRIPIYNIGKVENYPDSEINQKFL